MLQKDQLYSLQTMHMFYLHYQQTARWPQSPYTMQIQRYLQRKQGCFSFGGFFGGSQAMRYITFCLFPVWFASFFRIYPWILWFISFQFFYSLYSNLFCCLNDMFSWKGRSYLRGGGNLVEYISRKQLRSFIDISKVQSNVLPGSMPSESSSRLNFFFCSLRNQIYGIMGWFYFFFPQFIFQVMNQFFAVFTPFFYLFRGVFLLCMYFTY